MPRMRFLIMCYRLLASLFSMSSLTHSLVLCLESFADGSLQSFQPSDWYHCVPSSLFGLVHTLIPTVADDSMPLNSQPSTVIIMSSLTAFTRV